MARKSALNYVFCNLLGLALTVLLAVAEAEGKGGGKNSNPTSSGSSSSPSLSSSGFKKPKTKKVKDNNSKITRCYNKQMVEITCPATKSRKIAGYVVGGIFCVIFLFILYTIISGKIAGRRKVPKANNRDLEADKKSQRMSDHEKGGARKDSDSSGVPPQYTEKATDEPNKLVPPHIRGDVDDSNPSGSTITPPIISAPVPEPAQPNHSPKPPTTTDTTTELLPMPATTPIRKDTLADKFKNALEKAKRAAAM